jgi:hypothetical protein
MYELFLIGNKPQSFAEVFTVGHRGVTSETPRARRNSLLSIPSLSAEKAGFRTGGKGKKGENFLIINKPQSCTEVFTEEHRVEI